MAHYAKLGLDNVVLNVVAVDNIYCMTRGGIEKDQIGLDFLAKYTSHTVWMKCSYNTHNGVHWDLETNAPSADQSKAFRANFPSRGWFYNSTYDIFHPPQPYPSWSTLNTTTGCWEPPIPKPDDIDGEFPIYYEWDEDAYQADNTQGWVQVDMTPPSPPSE